MIAVKSKNQRKALRKVKQLSFRREVGDRILTPRGIEKVVSKNQKNKGHHILKDVVCHSPLFLGCLGMEPSIPSYPHTKVCSFHSQHDKFYSMLTLTRTTSSDDSDKRNSLIEYNFNVGGIINYKVKETYSFGTKEYVQADKQLKTPWKIN